MTIFDPVGIFTLQLSMSAAKNANGKQAFSDCQKKFHSIDLLVRLDQTNEVCRYSVPDEGQPVGTQRRLRWLLLPLQSACGGFLSWKRF